MSACAWLAGETPANHLMKHRAFTLIELLVVVAIIMTLIAILLPSMNKSVQAAHRAVCMSNQRQIMAGGIASAAENQGQFLPVSHFGWEYILQSPSQTTEYNVKSFTDNLSNPEVFYCPSREGVGTWDLVNTYPTESLWNWSDNFGAWYGIEHITDYWLYFLAGHDGWGTLAQPAPRLSDPIENGSASSATTMTCWPESLGISGPWAGTVYPNMHGREGLPSAFLDGHSEFVDRSELVYDGRPGVELLRSIRRPYVGSLTNQHPLSAPLN